MCYRGSLHATIESVLYERVAQASAVATRPQPPKPASFRDAGFTAPPWFGLYTILPPSILYGVWHTKGGSVGECILRNGRQGYGLPEEEKVEEVCWSSGGRLLENAVRGCK